MELSLILKVAGLGMLVSVICQILGKAGREEQATLVSLIGLVVVLILVVGKIGDLFSEIKEVFGLQ